MLADYSDDKYKCMCLLRLISEDTQPRESLGMASSLQNILGLSFVEMTDHFDPQELQLWWNGISKNSTL